LLKITADENIPYVREAFGTLGDVTTLHGRRMTSEALRDADLLLVRSITKVNRDLLDGTPVHFVATATIGEDHVDKAYLAERGIAFSSAPGCNANSVGQYIAAALLELANGPGISGRKLGIVGVGNVGKRVLAAATALGFECVLNDPPLARKTGDPKYRPLEAILDCDIVTLHVPITKTGPDATYHLADESSIRRMKRGSVLINSARGPVTDTVAVKRAIDDGHLRACVLDVWEGEPNPDIELVERTFIATPHIAGYSFDGKVNGTRQIYAAACAFLGKTPDWDPTPLLPAPECPKVVIDSRRPDAILEAVRAVYDIRRDDAAMRGILGQTDDARGAFFDRLRKAYPRRREFFNTEAEVVPGNAQVEGILAGLGFVVKSWHEMSCISEGNADGF